MKVINIVGNLTFDLREGNKTEGGPGFFSGKIAMKYNYKPTLIGHMPREYNRSLLEGFDVDCVEVVDEELIFNFSSNKGKILLIGNSKKIKKEVIFECLKRNDGPILISPVFNEVNEETINEISLYFKDRKILVDIQGLIRRVNDLREIFYGGLKLTYLSSLTIHGDIEEISSIFGDNWLINSIKASIEYNIDILIGIGKEGAMLVSGSKIFHSRPSKTTNKKVIGAGDVLSAVYLIGINNGLSKDESLNIAVKESSEFAASNNI